MPYQNVPESQWGKMDRCVEKVQASGKSKESAIAICYASIVEGQIEPGMEEILMEFKLDKDLTAPASMAVDMAAQPREGRPFDGMRAGTFIDMRGTPVTFAQGDLQTYLDNTLRAIAATRSESGEVVGLPIDAQNHNKGDAAGWIIDASLSGDIIRLTPRWTDLGLDLIGSSRQRFFSPTVDLEHKTIIGGSLTNWPATRAKGKTLLRPIELAEGDSMVEEMLGKIMEMLQALWAKVGGEQPETPEMPEAPAPEMAMGKKAAEFAAVLESALNAQKSELERKQSIANFAQRIVSGTPENPRGLNLDAAELAEALTAMDDAALGKVKAMLEKAVVVDFSESGKSGSVSVKEAVPGIIAPYLRQWIEAGNAAEAFFSINPEIGRAEQFDLTPFVKG